jgi:phospholipase/carboxylesterase
MVPFEPTTPVRLPGTPVWLGAGRFDPIIPAANVERLAELLTSAGARLVMDWREAGHNLTPEEIPDTAKWLEQALSRKP